MSDAGLVHIDGLHWRTDGCAGLSGELLRYSQLLDAVFAGWADDLDAEKYEFPDLIPAHQLAPIGYLDSFPHLATFATSARRDEASIRNIAAHHASVDSPNGEHLEPLRTLLSPAACYHFYPLLAGRALSRPLYLTTNCLCHRREEHYAALQRQWSFRMRELVCVGDRQATSTFVAGMRQRIEALIAKLGIDASWHTATDPFFDPLADSKALTQIVEPVKTELRLAGGLAIASLNRHRSFFGQAYDIRYEDEPAQSACVAFGIERWLYALIDAHGPDLAAWPAAELRR